MSIRNIPLSEALVEVSSGVGPKWSDYRVLGATRAGLALAKEPVGKSPERYKLVEPGTIFYNPMRIMIGSIAMVDDGDEPGITSPDYVVFRTRPGVLHHRWFYYWLRSKYGEQFIRSMARGAVRERLLFKRLVHGAVPAPPWDEQVATSEKLAGIARAVCAAGDALSISERLPLAFLRDVFNDCSGKRWPQKNLADVCEIQLGKMLSPKSKIGNRSVPYIRNANVQWNRIDLSDVYEMDFTEWEEKKFALRPGDLLVCEGGEPGRCAVWEGQIQRCCYQKAVHRLRPIAGACEPRFVMYRLQYGALREEFQNSHGQTTIAHLPAIRLARLIVPVPPVEEQQQIAAVLDRQIGSTALLRTRVESEVHGLLALTTALVRGSNGNG